MICRYCKEGTKISVADLNEITVLIDRSETELTEVALNSWRAGLIGPPHWHEQKEQIFFVVSGRGTVRIGDETNEAGPGDFFYIPADVLHHTVNRGDEPFEYLLFNAFLDSGKEGHASFAEHVEKVKETRRQQAQTQGMDAGPKGPEVSSKRRGKHIAGIPSEKRIGSGSCSEVTLLDRIETQRCEAFLMTCPSGRRKVAKAGGDKEQVLFALSGTGSVTVAKETASMKVGDVVFVPRNTAHNVQAGAEGFTYLSLGTIIGDAHRSKGKD